MATGTTKTATRGRNRTLGVRTWLGAGALTLGVGAALAGATAVAQADTGGHSSSSSSSDAGPTHRAGVATTKRVNAPVAKVVSGKPAVSAAAARKTAVASLNIGPISQTIDTPFGPISVAANGTIPDIGGSGDVELAVDASTPIGQAQFSVKGTGTSALAIPPVHSTAQISLTSGKLVVPGPVAFLVSAAGWAVLGAASAYDSFTSFATAVQTGDVLGAVQAFIEGGPRMTSAVLFGEQTLTVPIPVGGGDPALLGIPFGGVFAPLRPVTLSWVGSSATQNIGGVDVDVTIDPVDITFEGTKFGGVAAALGQLIGLL